jgi:hypothetical protein
MTTNLRRKLAVGAAVATVAAGGGIAYAATQSSSPEKERQAFLDDAAKRLNVTPGNLESALKDAAKARVDQAVADGRLTKAQGDEIKKHIDQGGGVPFLGAGGPGHGGPGGPGGPGGGPGFGFRHGPFGGAIREGFDTAAKYLGLTRAKLLAELRDGKSLADVAKAQGKVVDGLKSTLRDAAKSRVDQAVKDKHLTQAQADDILEEVDEHLDDLVNATPPKRPAAPRLRGHHAWF